MKIPKYWAKGQPLSSQAGRGRFLFSCWGWSDSSLQDAANNAARRTSGLAAKAEAGARLDHYLYGEHLPLREEIVQSVPGANDDELAVVTRNGYGALVLNTARAMFIDIDFPAGSPRKSAGGIFGSLFGKKPKDGPEQQSLANIRGWASRRPGVGVRVYRTCAGMRCLITNQVFDPMESQTQAMLKDAGSDPLYIRLCQAQTCFRARLTPKPWRCAIGRPPTRYPWSSRENEARFRQWQAEYERTIGNFSVCRLIEQIGSADVHPEVEPIVALHDKFTCQPDRELA